MPTFLNNRFVSTGFASACITAVSLLVVGCVSPKSVLFTEGPTMQEVLQGAQGQRAAGQQKGDQTKNAMRLSAHVNTREVVSYDSFTRDSVNETTQLFPKLKNPTFSLYVNPHLSTASRAPVPGYTTVFSLYNRDEYALPEEVPPNRNLQGEDLIGRQIEHPEITQRPFEPGAIVEYPAQ